jgi:hypothetical protein
MRWYWHIDDQVLVAMTKETPDSNSIHCLHGPVSFTPAGRSVSASAVEQMRPGVLADIATRADPWNPPQFNEVGLLPLGTGQGLH